MAKLKLNENHKEYPACCHWFALELYNLHHKLNDLDLGVDDITVKFLKKNYIIKKVCLNRCVKNIKDAIEIHKQTEPLIVVGVRSEPLICSAELTYTSLYSRALDNFLFSEDCCEGASLHEFPSRIRKMKKNDEQEKDGRSIERSDITVVSLPNLVPIMCSDIKTSDFDCSVKETILYGVNCATVQSGDYKWPLLLGMPGTPSKTMLQVYMPIPGQFWRSTIIESTPDDMAFLCTLFVGVRYLLSLDPDVDYVDIPLKCYCPKKDVEYEVVSKNKPWIVKQGKKCLKIFDKKNNVGKRANLELLDAIGLSYKCKYLSKDHRFLMIVRDFIVGDIMPCENSDITIFKGALECLKKVHECDYIHGDVRSSNIIFTADGTSHLIDFDLAKKTGSFYPVQFLIQEEYPNLHHPKRMKTEHDVHHMKRIMSYYFHKKWWDIHSCDTIDQLLKMIDEKSD